MPNMFGGDQLDEDYAPVQNEEMRQEALANNRRVILRNILLDFVEEEDDDPSLNVILNTVEEKIFELFGAPLPPLKKKEKIAVGGALKEEGKEIHDALTNAALKASGERVSDLENALKKIANILEGKDWTEMGKKMKQIYEVLEEQNLVYCDQIYVCTTFKPGNSKKPLKKKK